MSRFDYVKYDEGAIKIQNHFKQIVQSLESDVNSVGNGILAQTSFTNGAIGLRLMESKEKAIEKLEEFYMWVGKAIRDEQLLRNKETELQEERKDG